MNIKKIIKIIPLQTIDESLLEKISKIEIYNGRFYLFNTKMNDPVFKEVMRFDSTGQFLNKLTSSTSSVSDFRYATDFQIEDNSKLFLEGVLKRILITDDDKISATIPLSTDGQKFIRQAAKFWIYRDNNFEFSTVGDRKVKNSNLVILNKNGKLLKTFVPIPKATKDIHIATSRVFYPDATDASIYFFPPLSDTIYQFSYQMNLITKYCIEENEELQVEFPYKFDSKDRNELLKFLNNPATCIDKYIFTSDNQLIFLLSTSQKLFIAINNKETNITTSYVVEKKDFSRMKCAWDGSYLYMLFQDPLNNKLLTSQNPFGIEELTVNSNPVILKLKVRAVQPQTFQILHNRSFYNIYYI